MTKYSNLKELTIDEQIDLVKKICFFFNPLNNQQISRELKIPIDPKRIKPLSLFDFYKYHKDTFDAMKNQLNLFKLIHTMQEKQYLSYAGTKGYTMGFEKCFYFSKEFTTKQAEGDFWLTEILGFNFLQEKSKRLVTKIMGEYENGDIGCGSGILISENIILTCAHVIDDMRLDKKQTINGQEKEIKETKTHSKIDIGIIKLKGNEEKINGLAFTEHKILDDILILGYPNIPFSATRPLISQRGEINGVINDLQDNIFFIYSTLTKPGNSGGPIFNSNANIIGIVSRETCEKNQNPLFNCYMGIPTSEIINAVKEICLEIILPIEDYQ